VISGKLYLYRRDININKADYLTSVLVIKAALAVCTLKGLPISIYNQFEFVVREARTFTEIDVKAPSLFNYGPEDIKKMSKKQVDEFVTHFEYLT
jgi:hypothetical protein